MKHFFLFAALLLAAQVCLAKSVYKLAGTPVDKYTVVYSAQADSDESIVPAKYMAAELQKMTGVANAVKPSDVKVKGAVINIVSEGKTFDYAVDARKGKVVIRGGSSWAINRAIDVLVQRVSENKPTAGFKTSGTVDGEFLFPRRSDVNLRILDDNIWDYSLDTLPPVWKQAGVDCRDVARAPEFAQIARAYMPDVLVLQEYSHHMHNEFFPLIEKYGYNIAFDSADGPWNNTPVFYNKATVELLSVNYNLYTPKQWSNKGSKSFTSAVFRLKANGKTFAVINTHLWWKGDKVQAGSTQARAAQVRLMMAEAEIIKQKYDCPVFVTGDMNCEESSIPMQQFIEAGYVPCYKAATVYGNTDNGHHACAPNTVGVRHSNRKGPERHIGAIDHCFVYNAGGAEVKVFDCLQPYFTVKLTDHYPNLIDIKL